MQTIGKFEIARVLGKGAQSVVYLARDPMLQRDVAVKLLHLPRGGAVKADELLREARTASKLQHRNVLPIFEAGSHQGQVYLVFEYVDGRTLERVLRDDGAIDASRAAMLMCAILDAVAQAHAAGVIHRDLKPSNILIDKDGQPRVMDFGIATASAQSSGLEPDFIGTPTYMAPEYIAQRLLTPQYDVFAAGLMLYEMLSGTRAIAADNAFQAMHQIANVPLVFAQSVMARIDSGLHQIVACATAKDPALRFQTAAQMRDALHAYLNPAADGAGTAAEGGAQSTLEFLLRRMKLKTDFPAMSAAISTIQRMTSVDKGDVNKLSNAILKDFALTNKILRLVNSAYYPIRSSNGINTVSRAIVMMGFNAVSSIATSLILFEHLKDKQHADALKDEFLGANMSAIISAELGAKLRLADVEQVYVCTVFHHLGRLLAQYYFREEAQMIERIVNAEQCNEDAAALRVLGISYQDLGIGIARSWGFPDSIVNSMRRLPSGKITKPQTADQRLHLLAAMSCELGAVFAQGESVGRAQAIGQIAQRFGDCVALNQRELTQVMEQSAKGLSDLAATLNINLRKTRIGASILQATTASAGADNAGVGPSRAATAQATAALAATTRLQLPPSGSMTGDSDAASSNGMAILAAGIEDISQALVDDVALSDLLRIIAETIFRAIDVKRVLMCTRDGRSAQMYARFGYGDKIDEVVSRFRFALNGSDLFNLILAKDADVLIDDARADKVRRHLPAWYLQAFDAPAFIVFPISVKNIPVAMIYADHDAARAIRISEKELALLRTLRNQAVMAIKQAR